MLTQPDLSRITQMTDEMIEEQISTTLQYTRGRVQVNPVDSMKTGSWYKARLPFARKPITAKDLLGSKRKSKSLINVEKAYGECIDRLEHQFRSAQRARPVH